MCGGTAIIRLLPAYPPGLSPRVRGNPGWTASPLHCEGSIPACAGEPKSYIPTLKAVTVYPRVCGGTLALLSCSA